MKQMLNLRDDRFVVEDLRFRSEEWVGKKAPSRLMQARLLWDNPESRRRLRTEVDRVRPNLLLFHNLLPVASLGLYREAKRLGIPVMQYIHNYRPFSPSGTLWVGRRVVNAAMNGNPWPEVLGRGWERSFVKTFLLAVQQRRLLKRGDLDAVSKWIAVSDFMRDRFVEGGMPADRVVTLRHCWRPDPLPVGVEEGNYYLFLGRLVSEKGVSNLLEAWSLLSSRLGVLCPHLIVAGTGPEERSIQERVTRIRKATCVGFVAGEQKRSLLRRCRGLLAPSIWWEPLGLIVHEAYNACRPVIAARSGGLSETVFPGRTGLLHKPGDATAIAAAVEEMESAGELGRATMGRQGRRWLEDQASPESWRDRFHGILLDAVSGGSDASGNVL